MSGSSKFTTTLSRAVVTPLARMLWRPRIIGRKNVPKRGAVILASNHRSFIDSPAITLMAPRKVSFLAKQEYFAADPVEILDIYLFRDEESYNRNARLLFGETPSTPFGYYSPRHKALVMNIAHRVFVLDHGEPLFEGTPREVQANPRVIEAYLGGEFAA